MKPTRILSLLLVLILASGCRSTRDVVAPTDDTPAPVPAVAEEATLDWHHLDASDSPFRGVSTNRAYEFLAGRTPAKKIVVAVIDSGVDIEHEDLDDVLWVNADEIAGNGIDDDNNGYVDDIHGWNFIGGADGRNIEKDTYELTREFVRLNALYGDANPDELADDRKADYEYYLKIKDEFEKTRLENQQELAGISQFYQAVEDAHQALVNHLGKEDYTSEDLDQVDTSQEALGRAVNVMRYLDKVGASREEVKEYLDYIKGKLEYAYNPEFDPRDLVGDDFADGSDRFYGNNDVKGPDASHGTHVAGIIAAERGNGIGMDGVANNVAIMAVRAVPDGDERDKDVANAIRYAVDNGAHIINMSFGKGYSPRKELVDEAVRYAEEKGVLLVHAAGNENTDVDAEPRFPMKDFTEGGSSSIWLNVGASSWRSDSSFVAGFSNYGQTKVDIFAPGMAIYSTLPEQEYGPQQGTSMAAPVVSGVAALVWSYFPELTAGELRQLLLDSSVRYTDYKVRLPGSEDNIVAFGALSATGGIVNAYSALKLAADRNM